MGACETRQLWDAHTLTLHLKSFSSSSNSLPSMPLEATLMIIDNSEYMRNGDYVPSRFDAQADAVNTVFQTKIDSNPENTVGLMTMAGKGSVFRVLVREYYL